METPAGKHRILEVVCAVMTRGMIRNLPIVPSRGHLCIREQYLSKEISEEALTQHSPKNLFLAIFKVMAKKILSKIPSLPSSAYSTDAETRKGASGSSRMALGLNFSME
ncbi:hypothetical protein HAX54_023124 [Datura stramonium]|uniref:Uncharacterized protein n=1 Tax=Datura stramonium TaxID=4076 RepID=A0ABS8RM45_DATST|nr:hypothetical protein [Datura stramonium]